MNIECEKLSMRWRIAFIFAFLLVSILLLIFIKDFIIRFRSRDIIFILADFFLVVLFATSIKLIVGGFVEKATSYKLDNNGISILFDGIVKREYEWESLKTRRIEYKGKGVADFRTSEAWKNTNACAVFCVRKVKKSIWQSSFPPEFWNEKLSYLIIFISGLPWIINAVSVLFRRHNVVRIYLEETKKLVKMKTMLTA